jgi:hypothetical protein
MKLTILQIICIFVFLYFMYIIINKKDKEYFYNANINCPPGQKSCKINSEFSGTNCALSACSSSCKGNPNIC